MSESIALLFTGDLHGRVLPVDPLRGTPAAGGVARAATVLRGLAAAHRFPVYLDLGDLVQGTPMSTLAARGQPAAAHPLVRILDELGCRGLVLGNHDFHFGPAFLDAQRRHARFPLLSANVLREDGEPALQPVLRLEAGGRRVAILALTTPQVPRWEEPWNTAGLTFRDAVDTAREWVPRLRADADAVVVAAHMGWDGVTDGSREEPVPPENDVATLVREVDGIDAVLMAHTHRVDVREGPLGTTVVQAGAAGKAVGEVVLHWESGRSRPRVAARVHLVELKTQPDPVILDLVGPAQRAADEHLERVIGTASAPFSLAGLRYRDNAILSLFHRVQLDASGADLSSAVVFRADEELPAGPITERDLFRLYPFENNLTILELTVDAVREYLEEIALVYVGPSRNGEPPPLDPMIRLYGHDALAPCAYLIDPTRPPGRRITDLRFDGAELPGDRRVSMATSSYRAQGGGGFRALRNARVVKRTGRDLRSLLGEYVRSRGTISPEPFDNWRVVGTYSDHLSGTSTGA